MDSETNLIVFRVDASNQIGTGHVMRCLTLARALQARGAHCLFLQRALPGHLGGLIEQAGFDVRLLPPPEVQRVPANPEDYAAWLGVDTEQDSAQCRDALDGQVSDWLVIDHYALDRAWESDMRQCTRSILVIDDLANRPHDCDLLVDQNYFPEAVDRYQPLLPEGAPILAGPRFALLARRYARARAELSKLSERVERILVYYGGVDAANETARALRVLVDPAYDQLEVDVVVGMNNPHRDQIARLVEHHSNMRIHEPQSDLVDLMLSADLALGAGGATTWERCALGLPTIVTSVAANQEPYNQLLHADGIVCYLGDAGVIDDGTLRQALDVMLQDSASLQAMAHRSWRLVDAWGTERVAEWMLPSREDELDLRPARFGDMSLLFAWVNDPVTRSQSFLTKAIAWEDHECWFRQRLAGQGGQIWICQTAQGLPVGEVRVDEEGDQAFLGFVMDPDFRDRGWAKVMLQQFARTWAASKKRPRLLAEVKAGNEHSAKLLESIGLFQPVTPTRGGWAFALEN